MDEKYLLGLDLGTDSIGWCVTDENFNVVRKGGKSLWGVRLFEEAKDTKERRGYRCSRRRTARRKERIDLLQSIFVPEMNKLDKSFFERLDLSKYHFEDRQEFFNNKTILFVDKGFTDKEYFNKYPTIYHLRKNLINSKEKFDLRLIYLAIHHIIKYRGNFLHEGKFNASDPKELSNSFLDLNAILLNIGQSGSTKELFDVTDSNINALKKRIKERSNITAVKEAFSDIFDMKDKYLTKVVVPLIAGGNVNVKDIYELEDDEDLEIKKIGFSDASFDLNIESVSRGLNNDLHTSLVLKAKDIYDILLMGKLLNGKRYVSDAMVDIYNNHKEDLKSLKRYLKNDKEKYDRFFRVEKGEDGKYINNYANYIGSNRTDGVGHRFGKCSIEDFYKFIRNELGIKANVIYEDAFLNEINEKMTNNVYFLKQNSTSNGVLPYQLNELELDAIIDNQKEYYPFLSQLDEEGYSNIEKIKSLLTFKIPYYVGPLAYNKANPSFYWAIKKEEGKIYPWNFDKKIDKDESAKAFIYRMLNKCTYLHNEYCLPKASMLFQEYLVYEFVNKLAINGNPITLEQKDKLINDLYKKTNVTKNVIKDYFKNNYGKDAKVTYLSGKDLEEVPNGLKTYNTMCKIFGTDYVEQNKDLIENIVRDITVFEDKTILEKRLRNEYKINDKEIVKSLKSLSYRDYGRLSLKFLNGISAEVINESGEIVNATIINLMRKTNQNLMEIINNPQYGFMNKIMEENNENIDLSSPEKFIDEEYVSPGMKRALIQSYKIIDELEKILNHKIDEYYIESTRSNKNKKGDKGRTSSRKKQIIQLYNDAKDITQKELNLKNELEGREDGDFRSDKLLLYFLQLGKSMYSGKPISIEDLYNPSICDIDHIIPQSIVKDDSLDNRVLVFQDENRSKKDVYPLPMEFRTSERTSFYKLLLEKKFISKEKYNRLIRTTELTDDEINEFDRRQLVYTNQSVQALAEVLRVFKDVDSRKIVLTKAENVSEFRQRFDIIKCRDINDLHHAHDAYLNILVGKIIFENKGSRLVSRIKKLEQYADQAKNQIFNRHDVLFTTRQYIGNSILNKVTILPAGKGDMFPVKNPTNINSIENHLTETIKYGGYAELSNGYYCLVESTDKRGNRIKTIEPMQNVYALPNSSIETKIKYLKLKGLVDPTIILDKMKINFVIEEGNSKYCVTGKTGSGLVVKNLKQAYYDYEFSKTIKKISKMVDCLTEKKMNLLSEEAKLNEIYSVNEGKVIVGKKKTYSMDSINFEDIVIDEKELINAYLVIANQLQKQIYESLSNIVGTTMKISSDDCKNVFNSLSIYKKCYTIMEMLKLSKCDRQSSNLLLLGLTKSAGILTINYSKTYNIIIVSESITGFYQKIIYDGR